MNEWSPFEGADTKGGRPSLFTPERATRVLEAIRQGLTYRHAAAYAGISYATLNRWRVEGRRKDDDSEICQFWKALQIANGEAALRFVGLVGAAAEAGNWKAATWILERRFPDEWGRNRPDEIDPEEFM